MLPKPALLGEKQPVRFQLELGGRGREHLTPKRLMLKSRASICYQQQSKGITELWGRAVSFASWHNSTWSSGGFAYPRGWDCGAVSGRTCQTQLQCHWWVNLLAQVTSAASATATLTWGTGGNSLYFSPRLAKTAPCPFPSLEHWCLSSLAVHFPGTERLFPGGTEPLRPADAPAPASTTLQTWLLLCDTFLQHLAL